MPPRELAAAAGNEVLTEVPRGLSGSLFHILPSPIINHLKQSWKRSRSIITIMVCRPPLYNKMP